MGFKNNRELEKAEALEYKLKKEKYGGSRYNMVNKIKPKSTPRSKALKRAIKNDSNVIQGGKVHSKMSHLFGLDK